MRSSNSTPSEVYCGECDGLLCQACDEHSVSAFVSIFYLIHTLLGLDPPLVPNFCASLPSIAILRWSLQLEVSISQGQWSKYLLTTIYSLGHSLTEGFTALGQGLGWRAESDPAGDDTEGGAVGSGRQACPSDNWGHQRKVISLRGHGEKDLM